MTHAICRLTAKNPTLSNRVWATFTFLNWLINFVKMQNTSFAANKLLNSDSSTSIKDLAAILLQFFQLLCKL